MPSATPPPPSTPHASAIIASKEDTPSPAHTHAPTASTPGPRASTLQNLFNDALSHTLRTCSYANFAACFPTPAAYVPEELDGFHRAFLARLETSCKKEFAGILDERGVVASLNELDALIAEARVRRDREGKNGDGEGGPTPPHLLNPSTLMNAHLAPFLNAQSTELESKLEDIQAANRALADEISGQRDEIERLLSGLEGVVADLEGAAGVLQGDMMEGVERELVVGPGVGG